MKRSAFTLLETIVCMVVLSIVLSMALVSIGSAREAARRIECMNRQKNVVLALQNHLSQMRRYPEQVTFVQAVQGRTYDFGPVFELLPFLEQGSVVDQVKSFQGYQIENLQEEFHTEWAQCPSDFVEKRINLRFCVGSLPPIGKLPFEGYLNNGIFGLSRAAKSSDVTRGTDTTIAISERIACNQSNKRFESMDVFGSFRFSLYHVFTVEVIRRLQGQHPDAVEDMVGLESFRFSYRDTLFNTVDPPNGKVRDVWVGDMGASVSARSRHDSGVNVGFASGAVRFVSDSVDQKVWSDYGIASE